MKIKYEQLTYEEAFELYNWFARENNKPLKVFGDIITINEMLYEVYHFFGRKNLEPSECYYSDFKWQLPINKESQN